MGYTHYWEFTRPFTADEWSRLRQAAEAIVTKGNIPITIPYEEVHWSDLFSDNLIRFNGSGDDAHEDFYFVNGGGWTFCKTNRKPYDALVVAVLSIAKMIAPDAIIVTSDGSPQEWLDSIKALHGYAPELASILTGEVLDA